MALLNHRTTGFIAAATIYLPLVIRSGPPAAEAIWPAGFSPAASHQVALFRTAVEVDETDSGRGTLSILADTRYLAYLDGERVGRGPSRFSSTLHEADVLPVELGPGLHWLAVLVQWAPNLRRSESTHPFLIAELRGASGRLLASSGPDWEASLTDAYRPSVQVHADGLIGPAEILDAALIPPSWTVPAAVQATFPRAAVVSRPSGEARTRSIPPLVTAALVPVVRESGRLSAGRVLWQGAGTRHVHMDWSGEVGLEAVEPAPAVRLNGVPVTWVADAERLDVVQARMSLPAGHHELTLADEGPVAVSGAAGLAADVVQGRHAGRRLLLAEPEAGAGVGVTRTADGLDIDLPASSYVVLDLGRTVHGRVVAVASSETRAVLDVGWSERLREGWPLPHPGSLHPEWNQVDSWILSGPSAPNAPAPITVETLDTRAGRYLLLAAWEGSVRLTGLRVDEESYLGEPIGSFSSDDPLLNRVWQTGADTLRANMTDGYADPWRERGQWWGDAYVAIHANRAVYGDSILWRRGLDFVGRAHSAGRPPALAPSGIPHTMLIDYGLLWIKSLAEYEQVTGDRVFTASFQPEVAAALDFYEGWEAADSGLLSLPPGPWQTKALIDWAGQFDREGEITALNALYAGALDAAARMAEAHGQVAAARDRQARADRVRAALRARLYEPAGHVFYTSRIGVELLPPWPHAQAWSLVYDVPDAAERESIAGALVDLVSTDPSAPNIEIYGFAWLLEALGGSDRIPDAAQMIRIHYGALLNRGYTTWPEVFNPEPRWSWSLSHGWGTAPTWFLTTYVLGARQTGPDAWQVEPAFEAVGRADGALPLITSAPASRLLPAREPPESPAPRLLQVRWSGSPCTARELDYTAPEARAATAESLVILRDAASSTIEVDGGVVWEDGQATVPGVEMVEGAVHVPGEAGRHVVLISAPEGACP